MFSKETNASKVAFIGLTHILKQLNFPMIDCQVHTNHLASLGARDINREQYLKELEQCITKPTLKGNWGELKVFAPLVKEFNCGERK
jgi:leucyl/phenylalanyl-tRNA--protein transferase